MGAVLSALARGVWPSAVLATLLFVAVNLLIPALPAGWRIDLTQDRLYTLAPATRAVLAGIDEPIDLVLYQSADLAREQPSLGPFMTRVRELLGEYVVASAGKLRLRVVDPAPFSPAEDRALAAGLVALPLAGGDQGYFGLAAHNSLDDRAVVPLFRPGEAAALEYDLTALIAALAVPERTRLAVLSPLPLFGAPPDADPPWLMTARLAEFFDLVALAPDARRIDPAVDVLMLVQPRALPAGTAYAVDQYLMAGGRAIVFVDPYSEVERRGRPAAARFAANDSDLGPFAASWGVRLAPDRVAADPTRAVPIAVGGSAGVSADNIVWLSLGAAELSPDDAIASALARVNLATAGVLSSIAGAAAPDARPLIRTSPAGGTVPLAHIGDDTDVRDLTDAFTPAGEPLTLALRLTGPAASAFPDGLPAGVDDWPDEHLAATRMPLDIVVVADTDLLADALWAEVALVDGRPTATAFVNNDAFVVNAVEALRGAVNLAPLRDRGDVARPFRRIEALRAAIDEETRAAEARLLGELAEAETALAEAMAAARDPAGADALRDQATEALRRRLVELRRELRAVQHDLRGEVEALAVRVRLIHIVGVPAAVVAAALAVAAIRRRRRAGMAA